jgi:hypothetical protein
MSFQDLPSPPWEGMKGRGDQTVFILSTPTRSAGAPAAPALARRVRRVPAPSPIEGGGEFQGNFRYLCLELTILSDIFNLIFDLLSPLQFLKKEW